jgi:hypothetical protein
MAYTAAAKQAARRKHTSWPAGWWLAGGDRSVTCKNKYFFIYKIKIFYQILPILQR